MLLEMLQQVQLAVVVVVILLVVVAVVTVVIVEDRLDHVLDLVDGLVVHQNVRQRRYFNRPITIAAKEEEMELVAVTHPTTQQQHQEHQILELLEV